MNQLVLALAVLLGSLGAASAAVSGEVRRETPFVGVTLVDVVRKAPRPHRIHAVIVDLRAEGLSVEVGLGRRLGPRRYAARQVRRLAREKGYAVAVNGGPYHPGAAMDGIPVELDGPVVHGGITRAKGRDRRAVLCILSGGRAAIRRSPIKGSGILEALAGFDDPGCLVRGRPSKQTRKPEPRTAAGVSRDGRTLVLVVVDGRQPGHSEGLTLHELGTLLREFGAHDGINLDGGGGTILVVADETGTPRTRNVPVGLRIAGTERAAGTCLGIFAKRLDGPTPEPEGVAIVPDERPLPPLPEPGRPSVLPPPEAAPPFDPESPVEPDPPSVDPAAPAVAPPPPSDRSPRRGPATWGILGAAVLIGLLVLLLQLRRRRS